MNNEQQLEELLIDWEMQRRLGSEVSAKELCKNCPELIPELKQLIEDFKATDWVELDDELAESIGDVAHLSTLSKLLDETQQPETPFALDQFCQRIVHSGLIEQHRLQQLQLASGVTTARAFADQLIANTMLTRFQAQVLLEGRETPLTLDGYTILEEIGRGGMGAVYKALHQEMDRIVALKVLPKLAVDSPEKVKRFQREVKTAARLEHSNIVTAFDARKDKGIHFLVMSYIDGRDLGKIVREDGPLSPLLAVNYIAQAAQGLNYAHGLGIIHRDIKPANILVDAKGLVRILDLGLARIDSSGADSGVLDSQNLTQTGAVMGTVAYLAPEQALDTRSADHRSDMYSLGCTLHFLLTGRPIYVEDTIMKTLLAHREREIPSLPADQFPVELNDLYRKMVAKQPEDRFQSMEDLMTSLRQLPTLPAVPGPAVPLTNSDFLSTQETVVSVDTSRSIVQVPLPPSSPNRGKWGPTLALIAGLAAASWWVAGVFLTVETKAGRIVLEIDQPELAGAEVSIDGEKRLTITTAKDPEPIEVAADHELHMLRVTKGGFETFSQQFAVKAGNDQTIKVRLIPSASISPVPSETGREMPASDSLTHRVALDPQRTAAEQIITLGGHIRIRAPIGSPFVMKLEKIPSHRFAISELNLQRIQVDSDSSLAFLKSIDSIDEISLVDTRLGDGTLVYLQHLQNVRRLQCQYSKVTEQGVIDTVRSWNLFHLHLDGIEFSDQGLSKIAHMNSLRQISGLSQISDDGIESLAGLDHLWRLDLSSNRLTSAGIAKLQKLKNLKQLILHGSGQINDSSIPVIAGLKSLRYLRLGDTGITAEGARSLQQQMPQTVIVHEALPPDQRQLEAMQWIQANGGRTQMIDGNGPGDPPTRSFALSGILFTDDRNAPDGTLATNLKGLNSPDILQWLGLKNADVALATIGTMDGLCTLEIPRSDVTTKGLAQLHKCQQIQQLILSGCKSMDDDSLAELSHMEHLQYLGLEELNITDAGLAHLAGLPDLSSLWLFSDRQITDEGVKQLETLPRLRTLQLTGVDVSDAAIPSLKKMPGLRILFIDNTKITAAGASEIQAALPKCVVFHESLQNTPWTPEATKAN